MIFVQMPRLAVLDVMGKDAARIANNLCTANIATVPLGFGREAFVTEVRGKAVGHGCIFRTENGVRMIGAGPDGASVASQAPVIVAHLDRYTIREQSVPEDRSDLFTSFLIDRELAIALQLDYVVADHGLDLPFASVTVSEMISCDAYQMPWWRDRPVLLVVDNASAAELLQHLKSAGGKEVGIADFHRYRIENRFPWYGVDIDVSNLPQEADRDDLAISFTKGCYLGQETIARLDALGQVQKKLVKWNVVSPSMPVASTELFDNEKLVGRLTSIVAGDVAGEYLALGFARRSHFAVGSKAVGKNSDGTSVEAVVSEA
jgi:folate-binding protein YgfZ